MSRTRRPGDGEEGAALVLALVFTIVMALIIVAIVNLSGTNIIASTHLQNERTLEYSAEGGVQAMVQNIRYWSPTYTKTFCGNGTTAVYTTQSPLGTGTTGDSVYCLAGTPTYERVVTFAACPSGGSGCNATTTSGAVLVATVLYNDLAAGCTPGLVSSCYNPVEGAGSTLGTSVTIESWVENRANG